MTNPQAYYRRDLGEGVGKYEVINAEASLLEGMASKEVISGFIGLERVLVGLGAFTSPHPLLSLNQ